MFRFQLHVTFIQRCACSGLATKVSSEWLMWFSELVILANAWPLPVVNWSSVCHCFEPKYIDRELNLPMLKLQAWGPVASERP